VTAHPTAAWLWRQLIEATAWGRRPRHLVRDRDAVYGRDFPSRAQALGIRTVLTPFRAPRANALAERVIRTLRTECLDHVLVLSERHLETVLREYAASYNRARPRCSLGLVPPLPTAPPLRETGAAPRRIVARSVLGGLHHIYERAA
jgi:transposase InsO family protein